MKLDSSGVAAQGILEIGVIWNQLEKSMIMNQTLERVKQKIILGENLGRGLPIMAIYVRVFMDVEEEWHPTDEQVAALYIKFE